MHKAVLPVCRRKKCAGTQGKEIVEQMSCLCIEKEPERKEGKHLYVYKYAKSVSSSSFHYILLEICDELLSLWPMVEEFLLFFLVILMKTVRT